MGEKTLHKSPPWIGYYNELDQLFGEDPEIRVEYDNETYTVKLYVGNSEKAEALEQLIPDTKEFGNITVKVIIVPANLEDVQQKADLFRKAFEGNPVLSKVSVIPYTVNAPLTYVAFVPAVAQYYDDNMADLNGNTSTLYENIARDVFGEQDGIFFCTDQK